MDMKVPRSQQIAPYMDDPPPRGLFSRLARVALHMARLQDESMQAIDLRFADYTVLAILYREAVPAGLPVSRLADLVLRPMGSITQILDRLARSGLVRREPDPSDRRMVLIAITPEGERVARRGAEVYDRVHARVLAEMDPAEVDQVDRGVRRLLEALEADLHRETAD